jgi:hypothetical protein
VEEHSAPVDPSRRGFQSQRTFLFRTGFQCKVSTYTFHSSSRFVADRPYRINPLKTCIDRTGGVARYSEKVYGQHLLSRVSKNFYSGVGKAPAVVPAPEPTLAPVSTTVSGYGKVADVLYRTWRYMYAWRA